MGQTIGRASIQSEAQVFLNLPRACVLELWEAFNEIAEGFGLTLGEVRDILRVALQEYLGCTDKRLDALSEALFHLYDDDRNSLVDSLEFLSSLAIVSGMSAEEKLWYVFGIFDFEESGRINVDAATLALRAAMSGLRKLAGIVPPLESDIDLIARGAFERPREEAMSATDDDGGNYGGEIAISREQFVDYAVNNPEIASWLAFFGDFDEVEVGAASSDFVPTSCRSLGRSDAHAIMGLDATSAEAMRKLEADNPADGSERERPTWEQMIALSEPPDLSRMDTPAEPNANLLLEWVHGRNTKVLGTSSFYTADGDVLYPAGAVVVKVSRPKAGRDLLSQEFYMEHTDYVTCLAVHHCESKGTVAATSQRGVTPKINVWTSKEMETLSSMTGFHRSGVSKLDFSPSGDLLLSVGMDAMNCIAIYRWEDRTAMFTSQCGRQAVLDARFLGRGSRFGVCGNDFVHFWERREDQSVYKRRRGLFGKRISRQNMTCMACVEDRVITGAATGDLCVWEGRCCTRTIQVHTSGSITAVHVVHPSNESDGGLCVSTSDGKIHMYNKDIELWGSYNIASYGGMGRHIQSVCWNPRQKRIMVGLATCELFEVSDLNGKVIGTIAGGHSGSSLLGLSVNPVDEDQVATVGADKSLRIWNASDHSLSRMVVLDTPAMCVAYTHDGARLIVGLGSLDGENQRKDGAFLILKEADLSVLYQAKDSKRPLTDVKCSKDGNYFAFGSKDHCIYIYDASSHALVVRSKGHSGPVTRIDFGCNKGSTVASFLQSNSENGEVMFWAVNGKKQTPSSQRNTAFETQSTTLAWSVKGAHGSFGDGSILQSCGRTNLKDSIAIVDDAGRLRLYSYPVISDSQFHLVFRGHAAMVGNAQFSRGDKWLFTVGGDDCCLIQWRHVRDDIYLEVPESGLETDTSAPDLADGEEVDRPTAWENANNCDVTHVFKYEEDKEDEANCCPKRPWRRAIVAPSNSPKEDGSLPDTELSLEWIHGYGASRCRSTLRYGQEGSLLYNVGNNLVRYKVDDKQQDFHSSKEEITCIALHPTLPVCALGQVGKHPRIDIIDYKTMETISIISGHQRRAISSLIFDPKGKILVSVGQDIHHTMCVHDWSNGTLLTSSLSSANKTLELEMDNNMIIQAGINILRFWTMSGYHLNFKNAYFGEDGKNQTFFSLGWDGTSPIVGTSDGHLYRFLGRKLDCAVRAHDSAVYSIHSTNEGNVSGSKDGTLKLWGPSLVCKLTISMETLGSLRPSIKSVCWNNEYGRLLVGTAGNEIWELSASDGSNLHQSGPLESGHFGKQTSGLSVSPNGLSFATVGDDATLRVWDLYETRAVRTCPVEMASHACAFSPDGKMIAVGFGALKKENAKQYHGKWIIVRETDFSILFEARDSRKMITELKWSPNGEHIAVGSWDNKCYLYDCDMEDQSCLKVSLSSVIDRHNSFITHIDFSADSKHLQINCGAYELSFYESATGLHLPAASRLKDVVWHSQTCPLGWGVQSTWSPYNDEREISTVDCTLSSEEESAVVASGDSFGCVKLFRYPCTAPHAQAKEYRRHCGNIAKARWAGNHSHLITVGSYDQAIAVWRHNVDDDGITDEIEARTKTESAGIGNVSPFHHVDLPEKRRYASHDHGLARPWVAAMVEPSKTFDINPAAPTEQLELSFVHGCHLQYTVNTIVYNSDGNIVFPSAKICVVYDKDHHAQKYYLGHEGQVGALCTSSCGRFIASGDISPCPRIRIWDSLCCTEIAVLQHFHRRGIACLAFSKDGKNLVSVGTDRNNSIAVWLSLTGEWHDAALQMHSFCSGVGRVYFVSFAPFRNSQCFIVSGGENHINFWSKGGEVARGIFGKVATETTMTCGAPVGEFFVTGTATGYLYLWSGRKVARVIKAHERYVNCLHSFGCGLATGGEDGRITVWSDKFEQISIFDITDARAAPREMSIRSVFASLSSSRDAVTKIVLGTSASEIYEVAFQSGTFSLIQRHHYKDEVWGLATHPCDADLFASCGDDGMISIWSVSQNILLRKVYVGCSVRAIAWSNDGKELLAGCGGKNRGIRDGVHFIIGSSTLKTLHEGRDSKLCITDAKYSPNSKMFALASADHKIYVYENSKPRFKLLAVADKNNSVVTSIDFSVDSYMIQSDSADYEHFCFNSDDGEVFSLPSQLKNVEWWTYTCCYGWPVKGIWPPSENADDDTKPVCAHRSSNQKLLAVGTADGNIKLYNYPVVSNDAICDIAPGHAYDIAKCRFSCDGLTLVTVGKKDRTIMVWKVKTGCPSQEDSRL